jgi:type IV secretory pathway TraG/TraD family ATPase VirD4
MSAQDDESAESMAKECGKAELLNLSRSVRIDRNTGEPDVSDSANPVWQELLLPHQARSLPPDRMLVLVRGVGSIFAKRQPYFESSALGRGKARPNPYV